MKIKLLRHFIAVIRTKKTDHEYLEFFVSKIMPLIYIICPELYDRFKREEEAFLGTREALEISVLAEEKEVFESLKQRLIREQIWESFKCKESVKILEAIFRGEPLRVFPVPLYDAYDSLKGLIYGVLKKGREDLVRDYAEICYLDERKDVLCAEGGNIYYCSDCGYIYDNMALKSEHFKLFSASEPKPGWVCVNCGNEKYLFSPAFESVIYKVPHVREFTFSPSFIKLAEHDRFLTLHLRAGQECSFYSAFNAFYRIIWSCETSPDFFRPRKKLGYENTKACERSAHLLELNLLRAEIMAIKTNKQDGSGAVFFIRDQIDKRLDIVFDEICNTYKEVSSRNNRVFPCSIELIMKDDIATKLYLRIEWIPVIIEICHLHTFQEIISKKGNRIPNVIYDFISALFENQGQIVKLGEAEGANVTKYLRQAGINELFESFFITNKKSYSAKLKRTRVTFGKRSKKMDELRDCLGKLKNIEWL